jgi:hypothetical protein
MRPARRPGAAGESARDAVRAVAGPHRRGLLRMGPGSVRAALRGPCVRADLLLRAGDASVLGQRPDWRGAPRRRPLGALQQGLGEFQARGGRRGPVRTSRRSLVRAGARCRLAVDPAPSLRERSRDAPPRCARAVIGALRAHRPRVQPAPARACRGRARQRSGPQIRGGDTQPGSHLPPRRTTAVDRDPFGSPGRRLRGLLHQRRQRPMAARIAHRHAQPAALLPSHAEAGASRATSAPAARDSRNPSRPPRRYESPLRPRSIASSAPSRRARNR